MKKTALFAYAPIALLVIMLLWMAASYNSLLRAEQNVKQSWSQVENQFQRRNDLIPNYVNVVKGYAKHERELFQSIADARARLAGNISPTESIEASNQLSSALSRLLMIVENYPQLRSNESFLRLQDELAGTENRIAVARRDYNLAVQDYNSRAGRFPTTLIVRALGYDREKPYFKAAPSADKAPVVNME